MFGYLSAGIVERSESAELVLHCLRHVKGVDEVPDSTVGDGLPGTGEGLQGLVGIGVALPAEYGLYALCHYLPVVGEVALDGVSVEYQFAQALLEGLKGDDSMGDGNAYLTL